MGLKLIFEYPVSWLIVVVLVAAVVSVFLYRRDGRNDAFAPPLRLTLAVLRFLALTIIGFFLLKPLVQTSERELEPPIVLVVQDNSQSIALGADSVFYQSEWPKRLTRFIETLRNDYDVRTYRFAEQLEEKGDSIDYSGLTTDLSNVIDGLYNRYTNRNIGAIVLASDGIYNVGSNPLYPPRKLNAPVYTIALGDTTVKRDLRIAEVATNKLAYLGNRFPMEIVVDGRKAAGMSSQLNVSHKGRVVHSEIIRFADDFQMETRRISLDANTAGLQKYTVSIAPIDREVTLRNNTRDVYIDVLENRQQILILAASPHPDIAALRSAISSNLTYEVRVAMAADFEGTLDDYSLIIFHRIPHESKAGQQQLNEAIAKSRPFVVVLGTQMDMGRFNSLKLGYRYEGYRSTLTDAFGNFAKGFPHFAVNDDTQRMFRELPPLSVPFGDFQAAPGVVSLVNRRIGAIETEIPLISFNQVNGTKIGLIGGEGLWRWRMVNYLKTERHERFDRLMSSMVQYLASRDDRRRFKVTAPREVAENERLVFLAEVYNASYESVNDPDVNLRLTNDQGEEYTLSFARTGLGYRAEARGLPADDYTWEADVNQGGERFTETGSLSIAAIELEAANTQANHPLLYRLATENGGIMVMPGQLDALVEAIKKSDDMVTLSYERNVLADLINLRWLLLVIIALLSVEWLLRKWSGNY